MSLRVSSFEFGISVSRLILISSLTLQHHQGWFTYSYCHNDEIRQFKEMAPTQPRFPGSVSLTLSALSSWVINAVSFSPTLFTALLP